MVCVYVYVSSKGIYRPKVPHYRTHFTYIAIDRSCAYSSAIQPLQKLLKAFTAILDSCSENKMTVC